MLHWIYYSRYSYLNFTKDSYYHDLEEVPVRCWLNITSASRDLHVLLFRGCGRTFWNSLPYMPRGSCQLNNPREDQLKLFGEPCSTYLASHEKDPLLLHVLEATRDANASEGIMLSYAPVRWFPLIDFEIDSCATPVAPLYLLTLKMFVLKVFFPSLQSIRSSFFARCFCLLPSLRKSLQVPCAGMISPIDLLFALWTNCALYWSTIFHIVPLGICSEFKFVSRSEPNFTLKVPSKFYFEYVPLAGCKRLFLSKCWCSCRNIWWS